MQRGVSVEQVRRAVKLAQKHGIGVGMFLMWGYEGEELEDIAATVEHVKQSNPEFSSPPSPIQSRGRPTSTRSKTRCSCRAWANATDRDYFIDGRKGKDYYRLADVWLRSEVEASRLANTDPQRAAGLIETAKQARDEMSRVAATVPLEDAAGVADD